MALNSSGGLFSVQASNKEKKWGSMSFLNDFGLPLQGVHVSFDLILSSVEQIRGRAAQ